eukprot:CAMPEP_0115863240 /NCGR_PEP_ID=MMETSP0287-20121206/18590_1 /TAXON_ID=412157 /ORGANISM="Chrysochromulina rotalis, Strain UIO044" /LENGTH=32 /DNA_ID= /DNA_START= /DNA_END= /DNA_ORIENTATION=
MCDDRSHSHDGESGRYGGLSKLRSELLAQIED